MNLKIKCDTPKEQVLVLRKFKKLAPNSTWVAGSESPTEWIPFVDYFTDECFLVLNNSSIVSWETLGGDEFDYLATISASDFLSDDWKPEPEKSEFLAKIESLQKQLDELKSQVVI